MYVYSHVLEYIMRGQGWIDVLWGLNLIQFLRPALKKKKEYKIRYESEYLFRMRKRSQNKLKISQKPTNITNITKFINLLKPTGHVMHQQFNIQQFYVLPTQCIYVFCIYLRTNSDLCHLYHKLIGFYNRDEKCLLRGTN